jgi:hypothetical protein
MRLPHPGKLQATTLPFSERMKASLKENVSETWDEPDNLSF